jgi:hypothetical protein
MSVRPFNMMLFALVAAYIVAGWGLAAYYDVTDRFSILIYSRPVVTTTLLLAVLFIAGVSGKIMIVDRPRHLKRTIVDTLASRWLTSIRFKQGLPVIIAFLFFMAAFTSLKSMIPVVQPYNWDAYFMNLDRLIHFGRDPWALLQPLLGYPLITFIINFIYNMWFPVMFGVLYWQSFTLAQTDLRARYLMTFFLCWIVNGTVLAMALSSVGPCFYGLLMPDVDNPFTELMGYLHAADSDYPIWALGAQDMLWSVYQKNALAYGAGIAAMPSLHVSIAFLQMLLAYKINRRIGHIFAVFFACILIGSVHLGWHYAVDGYLSIITTFILWAGMGYCTRGNHA